MSTRNGSYARQVDAQTANRAASKKAETVKASPSPHSVRPAFDDSKAATLADKAKSARQQFAPAPSRAPQPRGMGETSVNRQAHINRASALHEQVEGPKSGKAKLPPKIADKARRAARMHRTAPEPDREQSPSR
jgi:hypothetical protein